MCFGCLGRSTVTGSVVINEVPKRMGGGGLAGLRAPGPHCLMRGFRYPTSQAATTV